MTHTGTAEQNIKHTHTHAQARTRINAGNAQNGGTGTGVFRQWTAAGLIPGSGTRGGGK